MEDSNAVSASMLKWGYQPATAIWDGKCWGLLISVFVHVWLWHLAFNLYWLWVLGKRLEAAVGSWRYLLFFVLAAMISSGWELAAAGDTGIGASGVVYGMFGFMWLSRDRYPAFGQVLTLRNMAFALVWLVGCWVATLTEVWSIGNAAHVAGLLFGLGTAAAFVVGTRKRLLLTGVGLLTAASLLPVFWAPWQAGWVGYRGYKAHLRGDYTAAIHLYERSLRLGMDPKWVWMNTAYAYMSAGDHTGFERACDQLFKLDRAAAIEIKQKAGHSEPASRAPPPGSEPQSNAASVL